METLKATVCGLNWLLPVITKMFNIHVHIQECVEWNLSEGQRNTRCAVNTGQAWWKQELKSIDCDQLQLLLLSLSQRVQTHRYYKAGCREGRGCCGNGRLHLMSEDDEGDSFLWIWGDAAHRQKMEYVCESWTLNTILLSNRNPSDCHLIGSEDVTKRTPPTKNSGWSGVFRENKTVLYVSSAACDCIALLNKILCPHFRL